MGSTTREDFSMPRDIPRHRLLPALLTAIAVPALAQPVPRPLPDPLDPAAAVPRVSYQSSLRDYKPLAEQRVGSWKDANDTVTRIGGWRAYAREAAQGDQATPPSGAAAPGAARPGSAAPAASVPAGGHAGHQKP
jgi:hypothetical protein